MQLRKLHFFQNSSKKKKKDTELKQEKEKVIKNFSLKSYFWYTLVLSCSLLLPFFPTFSPSFFPFSLYFHFLLILPSLPIFFPFRSPSLLLSFLMAISLIPLHFEILLKNLVIELDSINKRSRGEVEGILEKK